MEEFCRLTPEELVIKWGCLEGAEDRKDVREGLHHLDRPSKCGATFEALQARLRIEPEKCISIVRRISVGSLRRFG